jgi:hypothetical protein
MHELANDVPVGPTRVPVLVLAYGQIHATIVSISARFVRHEFSHNFDAYVRLSQFMWVWGDDHIQKDDRIQGVQVFRFRADSKCTNNFRSDL